MKDEKTSQRIAIGILAGLSGVLLTVAQPQFSRDAKIISWLALGSAAYTLFLWIFRSRFQLLSRNFGFQNLMTFVIVIVLGAVLGAFAGVLAWAVFPKSSEEVTEISAATPDSDFSVPSLSVEDQKQSNPAALVLRPGPVSLPVAISPLIPAPDEKPASPDDLDFYFFALVSAAAPDNVQYADVTVTNRSERKMHLEIWGHWDYWKDSGEPARQGLKAEWNPDGLNERTGTAFIDLDSGETKIGRLVIFLGKPPENEISQWFLDSIDSVYLEVFDSVSGKRAAFRPAAGYPAGQLTSPVPPPKEIVASTMPELLQSNTGNTSPDTLLELVLRTRSRSYNDTNASVNALIKNHSSKPMQLETRLFVHSSNVESAWGSVDGSFEDSEDKSLPAMKTIDIEPGKTLVGGLTFDLANFGVSSDVSWSLKESPSETLLEITDKISGQKVWCSPFVGYPPAVDVEVVSEEEIPNANSSD